MNKIPVTLLDVYGDIYKKKNFINNKLTEKNFINNWFIIFLNIPEKIVTKNVNEEFLKDLSIFEVIREEYAIIELYRNIETYIAKYFSDSFDGTTTEENVQKNIIEFFNKNKNLLNYLKENSTTFEYDFKVKEKLVKLFYNYVATKENSKTSLLNTGKIEESEIISQIINSFTKTQSKNSEIDRLIDQF